MRIAVGQLWQETNTFNRNSTVQDDFENWGVATGSAVIEQYGQTGELGGFRDACREWDPAIELVGLARFVCWPWGRVESNTWQWIQQVFAAELARMGPVDGVLMALHGAMAAVGEDDISGAMLQQIRQAVGPAVPVAASLDLHANITPRMLQQADLLSGYHTCPHLDAFETGQRAARGLRRVVEQGTKPPGRKTATYSRKLPMIVPAETHNTFTGLPAPLYRKLEELERQPEILSAGLYMAMPWFDCPRLGWTITLTATSADNRYERTVAELAEECWKLREPMSQVERLSPRQAVARARSHSGHPVVIGDGADSTNSGSPGDATSLLAEFLAQQPIPRGALTFLVDPEAVAAAHQVGLGGTFGQWVGGQFAPEFSSPIELRGTVERLLEVSFILNGHIGKNLPVRMGRGAVIRSGDVTVLLVERSGPGSSPLLYRAAGLEPADFQIVVAKSPAGFRAEYEPFAAEILLADSPGCATPNWSQLKFRNVNRPLWPLNRIETPAEAAWCRSGS